MKNNVLKCPENENKDTGRRYYNNISHFKSFKRKKVILDFCEKHYASIYITGSFTAGALILWGFYLACQAFNQ